MIKFCRLSYLAAMTFTFVSRNYHLGWMESSWTLVTLAGMTFSFFQGDDWCPSVATHYCNAEIWLCRRGPFKKIHNKIETAQVLVLKLYFKRGAFGSKAHLNSFSCVLQQYSIVKFRLDHRNPLPPPMLATTKIFCSKIIEIINAFYWNNRFCYLARKKRRTFAN